jgi:hypothetical protein
MRYSVFSGDRGGLRAFARPRRAKQYYVHAFIIVSFLNS